MVIHKKAQKQKLNKLKKFERKKKKKKNQISALFSTQRPPDDWSDALDHLCLVLL